MFDTTNLLKLVDPADEQLRLVYVLYGAMNPRADWRQVTPDNLSASVKELKQKLIPVLRTKSLPAKKDDDAFAANLVAECKSLYTAALSSATERGGVHISATRGRGDKAELIN